MSMTHYMGLLASNQPWNLIIFMAVPVILAETIAITELYLLFTRNFTGYAKSINRWAGIVVGVYFLGIFFYLFKTVVIPLTVTGGWYGFVDMIAVGFYLLGVVPLLGMTLLELGYIQKGKTEEEKLKVHAVFVAVFLVVAHIAMIFGMVNPDIFSKEKASMTMNSQEPQSMMHQMADGSFMSDTSSMGMDASMSMMTEGLMGKKGDAFDNAFLSEMIVHHQGAVEMAELVLKNSQRPELRALAKDIISAQTKEISQMEAWRTAWYK